MPNVQPKRSVWRTIFAGAVVLSPVLWVAAYGLLLWLDFRGLLPEWGRGIRRVLAIPLWWASQRSRFADRLLVRYIELCQ